MTIVETQPTPSRNSISTILKFIFFLGIGLFVIWLSVRNLTDQEKDEILHSFRIANYNWVVLVIILGVFSHFFRSLRWILLLETMGYKPRIKTTFYAVMVGYFANHI
ncbi:MAG: lysylphosphatidylglycerol synthase domain-containing protein [Bacteroidota bacterium]